MSWGGPATKKTPTLPLLHKVRCPRGGGRFLSGGGPATKKATLGVAFCMGGAGCQASLQDTTPVKAVTSTMMPKAMRYQANGTKLLVEM